MNDNHMGAKLIVGIIAIFLVIFILSIFLPFTIIGAGERGVVMKLGKVQSYVLDEGLHFRMPLQDEIKTLNVKTNTTEIKGVAGSSDSQVVTFTAKVNWKLNPKTVNVTYQTIGTENDVEQNYIATKGPDSIKASISKFQATDLLKNRETARKQALDLLMKRVGNLIIIEDISFTDIDFSKEFNDAIEAKVTAEQEALSQKNKLESIKYQAQQKIETAKAEAESIRIQTEALSQNQNLIELRKAEALLESAKKGQKIVPDTILGGSNNLLYGLN